MTENEPTHIDHDVLSSGKPRCIRPRRNLPSAAEKATQVSHFRSDDYEDNHLDRQVLKGADGEVVSFLPSAVLLRECLGQDDCLILSRETRSLNFGIDKRGIVAVLCHSHSVKECGTVCDLQTGFPFRSPEPTVKVSAFQQDIRCIASHCRHSSQFQGCGSAPSGDREN
jgi:hypothetical protein